ncbi:MAG: hypothetical protein P4M11_03990 [Candidatus Pacebacteria bacterium]|nr:hypothetical protein [Candidatus Paceibacterota bacterium]
MHRGGYVLGVVGDSQWSDVYSKELFGFTEVDSAYSQESLEAFVNRATRNTITNSSWNFLISIRILTNNH